MPHIQRHSHDLKDTLHKAGKGYEIIAKDLLINPLFKIPIYNVENSVFLTTLARSSLPANITRRTQRTTFQELGKNHRMTAKGIQKTLLWNSLLNKNGVHERTSRKPLLTKNTEAYLMFVQESLGVLQHSCKSCLNIWDKSWTYWQKNKHCMHNNAKKNSSQLWSMEVASWLELLCCLRVCTLNRNWRNTEFKGVSKHFSGEH